ncbi:MAG: DMT family transporter [Chloroflexota bacterium]|nr:DMT family transporter [Chloroflexota bacterium]
MAIAFAFTSAVLWGSSAVINRLGLLRMPSVVGAFISMLVSLVLIMTLALIFDFHELVSVPAVAFGWLALLGVLNFLVGRYMNMSSIRMAGSSRATPVVSISPLFAATFAFIFLGERPTAMVIVGTLAVIGGIILIVTQGLADTRNNPTGKRAALGTLVALGAALGYGASNVVSRHVVTSYTTPLVGSAFSLLFGTIYLLPLALRAWPQMAGVPKGDMRFIAVSGLMQGVGVTTMMAALQRVPVAVAVPIGSLNPLVALALAAIFLGKLEKLTPRIIGGTLMAVGGVALVVVGRG